MSFPTTLLRVAILQVVGTTAINPLSFLDKNLYLQNSQEPNLCVNGKLLPKLYVLGAKNCGTTSLYEDLKDRGFWNSPNNRPVKEWFFLKNYWQLHTSNTSNELEMSLLWFSNFLDCPQHPALMGDFSVPNLFVVPLPPEFHHSKEFGYRAKRDHPKLWNTAVILHKFYGDQGHRVQFVIILREPLARMQSEYYHTRTLHNCKGCMANESFVDSLDFNVKLALRSPPEITDWIWKSMYARQIEEYIRVWDPKQFMIVPFRRYVDTDTENFTKSLIRRLNLRLKPWSHAAHGNKHEDRPALLQELPTNSSTHALYTRLMNNESKRLVVVLAHGSLKGMELQGYMGKPGEGDNIWDWLRTSW